MKTVSMLILFTCLAFQVSGQTVSGGQAARKRLKLGSLTFELHNVTGEVVRFQGRRVLKVERDLKAIPFDANNIEKTVDEPHYARLLGIEDFENGTIEVKLYSQIQNPAPYPGVAGFIGMLFRVKVNDSAFEGIYLRPKVGRSPPPGRPNQTA